MKKWIWVFLLCAVLTLTSINIASAEDPSGQCGDNLNWSYDSASGTLTISGSGEMTDFSFRGAPWNNYRAKIKTVNLPEGLTSIGDYAFTECYLLSTITIPDGVKRVGIESFHDCFKLKTVSIPNNMLIIDSWAFYNCQLLPSITLPNQLEYIGEGAFWGCYELESLFIPQNVKYIGPGAFADCIKLDFSNFIIDSNNTHYKVLKGAILSKDGLFLHTYLATNPSKGYALPDGVIEIGEFAFRSSDNLTSVFIPDSVSIIDQRAFDDCSALTSIRIPYGVESIEYYTFGACNSLEWIVIPNTIKTIKEAAFCGCNLLNDVYFIGTEDDEIDICFDNDWNDSLMFAEWHYVNANYTVFFDSNNGSGIKKQTVRVCDLAQKPVDPKKSGYTFRGWYLGSTPYDFSTLVTEDITLKAKWVENPVVEMNPNAVQFNGKTPYVIYNGKAQTPGVIVKDKSGKTLAASQYTVSYRDNTNPGTGYADVTIKSTGAKVTAWFKIYLPATTATTVANVKDGIQISWKAVSGAKGYVIYRRAWNLKDAGWTKFERWNNTKNTTWVDTKVYAGTRYQYGVKAYFADPMDNYNLGIVGPLKTTVRITTRVLNSVTPSSKKLTAKWTGSSLFTGYQVQVATDAAFTKDVQTVTVSKAKTYQTAVSKLKPKTVYYVRVRSYHVFDGTTYYGGWSNVLNGKTK